ncbi:taperin-like [Latimeria chalumnae]|uniref:taperin-like n=1 Tax=Latimeria chalumnae TaxID=7897 RepID=UPI0003C18D56|nr:PREDICTED: taperin-like [Latimeria chalumnae]|eukprot:XP_014339303.1 PREDICTED: taperin-like [Latimeria chalumnae]
MAGLPEWKVQLLERKRREEEESKRREKEQQERLAKMPAWKREIIERRRAKIGSGASFSETSGHAEGSSCSQSDTVAGAPGANNPDQGRAHVRMEESTVLRENIGPVNQNPFIKLERQRKDCSEAEASPKVRQIAELYSQMPGVRTIRAENIIIIESDPQYFSRKEAKEEETKPRNLEALTELMSKRGGSGVTEIRASEVLIIKSSLSRSVEDLNSMKREEEEGEEGGPGGRGRVSQLLSKFGHEKGWRPMRSRSTENIMDNASRSTLEEELHGQPLATKSFLMRMPSEDFSQCSGANDRSEKHKQISKVHGPVIPTGLPPLKPMTPQPQNTARDSTPLPHPEEERPSQDRARRPPPRTVAAFCSQFEAKSEMRPHEVQYPESPHRSLGHPEVGLRDFSPCTIESNMKTEEPSSLKHSTSNKKHSESMLIDVDITKDDGALTKRDDVLRATSDSHHDSEGTPSFHPTESHHVSADESNIPSLHSINETTVTPRRSLGPGVIGDVVVDCSGEAEKKASSSSLTLHESKSKPTPNLKQAVSASTSLNDSFEIHPASTPDLSGISEDDVQAKALAGLRLQSKNSFVVVPKRQQFLPLQEEAGLSLRVEQEVGSQPKLPAALSHSSPSCARELLCAAEVASCVASVETSLSFSEDGPPAVEADALQTLTAHPKQGPEEGEQRDKAAAAAAVWDSPSMSRIYNLKPVLGQSRTTEEGRPPPFTVRTAGAFFSRNEKAVAQVQPIPAASPDSELSLPLAGLNQGLKVGRTESPEEPPARSMIPELGSRAPRHPAMQRKSGNTITINPRKMAASKPAAPENGEATETETAKKAEGPKAATPSKKRYPTVEEIQVIGGYLSLERSCLAKKNATRKKVKISFNETQLESTFEYPSESALLEEFGPEEEEEPTAVARHNDEDDEEEVLLPRHGVLGSPSVGGALRKKPLLVDESCKR